MRRILLLLAAFAVGLTILVSSSEPAGANSPSAVVNSSDVPGDADCNDATELGDVLAVAVHVAAVQPDALCLQLANVLCEDGLTIDDAMIILRWIAGLSFLQPARCFTPGTPIQGVPISQGTSTIHGTSSFDFDAGAETNTGADVWWENLLSADPIDMKLNATGGKTALLTGADFDTLNVVALNATPYSDIAIDGPDGPIAAPNGPNDLPVGAVFGVLTGLGNYAKVRVTQSGYNLEMSWVTYSGSV